MTVWSGHVAITKDDSGKITVNFLSDATPGVSGEFEPSGFFETKAVNALIHHLNNQ